MKLEVGMYLRHSGLEGEYPIIQKITELKKPGRCGGKYKVFTDKCGGWFIDSDYIELDKSKYNFDLLELIEVGDYVNGSRVVYFMIDEEKSIKQGIDEKIGVVVEEKWETTKYLTKDIKSIVTKELFEDMSYKVGE